MTEPQTVLKKAHYRLTLKSPDRVIDTLVVSVAAGTEHTGALTRRVVDWLTGKYRGGPVKLAGGATLTIEGAEGPAHAPAPKRQHGEPRTLRMPPLTS